MTLDDYQAAILGRVAAHCAREGEKDAAESEARELALAEARAYVWALTMRESGA